MRDAEEEKELDVKATTIAKRVVQESVARAKRLSASDVAGGSMVGGSDGNGDGHRAMAPLKAAAWLHPSCDSFVSHAGWPRGRPPFVSYTKGPQATPSDAAEPVRSSLDTRTHSLAPASSDFI